MHRIYEDGHASVAAVFGIAVVDTAGVIRCLQNPKGIGVSLGDKQYIKDTLTRGQISIGLYTKGRVSHELVLPISVPMRDAAGKITGAVAGSLSVDWLQRRLIERVFAKNSALTIADREGTIIARFPESEKFVGTRIPEPAQNLVRSTVPGTTELTSQDGTHRIIAYFPPAMSQSGLYVGVGLSTEDAYAAIRQALLYGVATTAAAIGVAALLTWVMAKYYIRGPVARLVSTVEAWRRNDEAARSSLSDKGSEFGVLSQAIDAYMDELVAARAQREKDEQHRELLVGELDHRVKNLLATVQALARQSFKQANLDPGVLDKFNARLRAMGEAHSVIMKDHWQTAGLHDVVRAAIAPFDNTEKSPFAISGPTAVLDAKSALALGMALHELCTNAAKYGALSVEEGKVDVSWDVADGLKATLQWSESGGPRVELPSQKGFGSTMIERMLAGQIGGSVEVHYVPTGLRCEIKIPLADAS